MKETINNDGLLFEEFTSRIFHSNGNLMERLVSILFAIIISEVLAIMVYRLISIYAENNFYSSFQSYSSFMMDMIDENENPFIPRQAMNRSSSCSSIDERKMAIDKMLITWQCSRLMSSERKSYHATTQKEPKKHFSTRQDNDPSPFNSTTDHSNTTKVLGLENRHCAICLESLTSRESISQSKVCNHVFHTECYHQWLEKHDTCPFCRKNVFLPSKDELMHSHM